MGGVGGSGGCMHATGAHVEDLMEAPPFATGARWGVGIRPDAGNAINLGIDERLSLKLIWWSTVERLSLKLIGAELLVILHDEAFAAPCN